MTITRFMLMATAVCATVAAALGQGHAEAPNYSVSRAARYWNNATWMERVQTGHVGCMATSGCEHKPICSVCDYSHPRSCDCEAGHKSFPATLASWFSFGKSSHQKCAPPKSVQKTAPKVPVQKCVCQKCCDPCRNNYIKLMAQHVSGLFAGASDCTSKCGCEPKIVKTSKCGVDGPAFSLPVPMIEGSGEVEGQAPERVDPAAPPEPMLEGANGVGTGVPSEAAIDAGRSGVRRSQGPRALPRLLPSQSGGVSRISYEQLIDRPSQSPVDQARTSLDVFEATVEMHKRAQKLDARKAPAKAPRNPLRK